MKSEKVSKGKKQRYQIIPSYDIFKGIKSNYILSKIYANLAKKKLLQVVKYSKKIQNRLNLSIINYKEFSEMEIEIITNGYKHSKFININESDKLYYHIYFNDNKKEIKNKYFFPNEDIVKKIKIIIDYQVKSFENLFKDAKCIGSINFKKFYRNNINNMSCMFYECSLLKEINISNFNTDNVTNMHSMFDCCSSLKELNLSNINTNNVINMSQMFYRCSSLKELNLSNFNTNNVTNMSHMLDGCSSLKKLNLSNFDTYNVTNMNSKFFGCSSLTEINLSNFNTSKVEDMSHMFYECSSLNKINLSKFQTNNVTNMYRMFWGCSNDLKNKIISNNKNIKDEAFD